MQCKALLYNDLYFNWEVNKIWTGLNCTDSLKFPRLEMLIYSSNFSAFRIAVIVQQESSNCFYKWLDQPRINIINENTAVTIHVAMVHSF